MTTTTPWRMPATQRAMIIELLTIRSTAIADLAATKGGNPDLQWRADRIADVERCNRELDRLGVKPLG